MPLNSLLVFGLKSSDSTATNLVGVSGTTIFWTGVGFAAFLVVVFTIVALRGLEKVGQAQYEAVRLLAAILAGAASGFMSGGAMVRFDVGGPGKQLLVLGTAGFGMAILVWMRFPPYRHAPPPAPTPPAVGGTSFTAPEGSTFSGVVEGLARSENSVAVFKGFEPKELSALVKSRTISTATIESAMELVATITVEKDAVRAYRVSHEPGKFTLERI